MASDGPLSDPADVMGSSDAEPVAKPVAPWRSKPLATPVAKPVAEPAPKSLPGQGSEATKQRHARKNYGKLLDPAVRHRENVKRSERQLRASLRLLETESVSGVTVVGGASGSGGPMPPPPPPPARWVPRPVLPPPPPPPVAIARGPQQPAHPPPGHQLFSGQQVSFIASLLRRQLNNGVSEDEI